MKPKLHLRKFELESLMYDSKLTQKQIAVKFNVSRSSVQRLQKKYDLVSLENHEKHYPENLTDFQEKCLSGSILGDDCIHNFGTSKYASLIIMHEISQKDYITYKYNIWKKFATKKGLHKQKRRSFGRNRTVLTFKTGCHPIFKKFRNDYYNGKTKIMNNIDNLLNPISLSFLFQDDGSRCKNGGLAIHTNSFKYEEVENFCNKMNKKFGWICYPQKRAENQWVAFFSNKTSLEFSEYIMPYVVPSMRYKLQGVYNHFKNPQRPHAIPFIHSNLLNEEGKIWSDLHGDMQKSKLDCEVLEYV